MSDKAKHPTMILAATVAVLVVAGFIGYYVMGQVSEMTAETQARCVEEKGEENCRGGYLVAPVILR